MQFEANPGTVLDVLRQRAAEQEAAGDNRLSLEIDRAMWLTSAHEGQQRILQLESRIADMTPKDAEPTQDKDEPPEKDKH